MDDEPRPAPPRRRSSEITSWIEWFGLARLVTSAVAVVVVCVGGWWLLRAPAPPVESSLPRSTTPSPATSSVLSSAPEPDPSVPAVSDPSPQELVVHVAGAVAEPGVYRFEPGARVADAVTRAGGATSEGRPHLLNLAGRLVDGMRVRVPIDGEPVDPGLALDVPQPAADDDRARPGRVVDVNVASTDELESLPGVGPATAAAIVAERERNGPFVDVSDLERVPGIGPTKVGALSELVTT